MSDTRKRATTSLVKAMAYLVNQGYEVAMPISDNSPTDLVARKKHLGRYTSWLSIQVKTAYPDGRGGHIANVSRTTKYGRESYGYDEVDIMLVVHGGTVYEIETRQFGDHQRLSIASLLKMHRARDAKQLSLWEA